MSPELEIQTLSKLSLEQGKTRTDHRVLPTGDSAKWLSPREVTHFPDLETLRQHSKKKVKQIYFPHTLIYCNKSPLHKLLNAVSDFFYLVTFYLLHHLKLA